MFLDDPSYYQDVCPLMGIHVPSVYFSSKRNDYCDAMKVLIGYCCSKRSSIINPLGAVCDVILSLTTEVICIYVFPGFWTYFPMILVQKLVITLTVAYINSPSM